MRDRSRSAADVPRSASPGPARSGASTSPGRCWHRVSTTARAADARCSSWSTRAPAAARRCGERQLGSAPHSGLERQARRRARADSRDMAERNYWPCRPRPRRASASACASRAIRWRFVGENIAAGHGSAQQSSPAGWRRPGHCASLMGREFAAMGAAVRDRAGQRAARSTGRQVFGSRLGAGARRWRFSALRRTRRSSSRISSAAPTVIALSATLNDGK